MNILVFNKYHLKYKCNYSYLDEYGDMKLGTTDYEGIVDGSDLIKTIVRLLDDDEFTDIDIKDNVIHIEQFNPMTGETADFTIECEEQEKGEDD